MDDLPLEVVLEIVKLCPHDDLHSLCLTARYLYIICRPVLYANVDLSIHNRGEVKLRPTDSFTHPSNSYWCTQVPRHSLSRQESFISAILGSDVLAPMVKSLTWTLLRPHTKKRNGKVVLGISAPGANRRRAILRIWEAFQRLTNVRILDLAWLSSDHGDPLADAWPHGLFPAATSIRLSGVMSYSFAASILYNNPAKLVHLTLDNLQQVGKGCDHFLYRQANQRPDYRQSLSPWNRRFRYYGASNYFDLFSSAGPMQNLLGPIAGRCPNLRSLTVRKVGEAYYGEFTRELAAKDCDFYVELAVFINSVKRTLRHMVFEQGDRGTYPDPIPGPNFTWQRHPSGGFQLSRTSRPMDERFKNLLLTTMREGWRVLQSMELRGVGDDMPSPFFTSRSLIDRYASSKVEQPAKRMDHIGLPNPRAG
ncbi:hypothetical protein BDR22DRAFT_824903 [Usnea florida]